MERFLRTVLQRSVWSVLVLLAVVTATFVISRIIPADPAAFLAGQGASRAQVEAVRAALGLDKPLPVQYVDYISNVLRGDLGMSIRTRSAVAADFARYLPATLELLVISFVVYMLLSFALGMWAALRGGRFFDFLIRIFSTSGTAVPAFWLGLVFQFVFYYLLGWLPADSRLGTLDAPPSGPTGWYLIDSALAGDWRTFGIAARHLVMPVSVTVFSLLALGVRVTRTAVAQELEMQYVATARSKGLGERTIVWKHVLRNALNPILTVTGIQFGYMFSWIILVEVVFNWPGIGMYAYRSFEVFDYAPIMGLTLISAVAFVVINLVTDLLYPVIDPRIG